MIKRLSKDKYKVIVENGKIDGKRTRLSRTVYGSMQEAKMVEAELIKDYSRGYISKKITLKEFSDSFIEDYCKANLKENTTFGYIQLLKVILKEIGEIKIDKITPYDLQKFYNKLYSNYNYSSNTVAHYYTLLNSMFRRAIVWGFIKENPNYPLDKPKIEKKEAKFYDYIQTGKLLEALKEEAITYRAMITLCIDSGMRREEINGLMWSDINFLTNEVSIKRVRLIVNKKEVIESPKTSNSKRTICITDETMQLLKELKLHQDNNKQLLQEKWNDTKYVFVTEEGKPYYPDVPSKILKRIIKRHGLEEITFHQLRHTSATLLIADNADISSVSVRLGHANKATTLNIYTHVLDKSKKEMANKMSAILKKC